MLPIDGIRKELEPIVKAGQNFILTAPTGSGKSTAVPSWLLDWMPEKTIYVLQPRRLPARMLSSFVASQRQSKLGDEVGYQVRFDHRISSKTRLIYLTEGLLLRMLLNSKNLNANSCFLFDEFHERHLEGDLALALAKQRQSEDYSFQIGVLSATLDPQPIFAFLGNCEIIEGEGRQFPVEINYLGNFGNPPVSEQVEKGLLKAIKSGAEPDFLVFLSGSYEINRIHRQLSEQSRWKEYEILRLYGNLPPEEQDRVVKQGDKPRIILSTNIAETSITLPSLKTVIDTGLARFPSYDPRRGINSITIEKISRASADQRAGRAGRIAPGQCFRLWTESDHSFRAESTLSEVKRLDLSEMLLQLSASGIELKTFPFFEEPNEAYLQKATALLEDVGAWKNGEVTKKGKEMSAYPVHPRFSRMLLAAIKNKCLSPILLIIALAQSRSIFQPSGQFLKQLDAKTLKSLAYSDFFIQIEAFNRAANTRFSTDYCRSHGIHAQACRTVAQVFQQLQQTVKHNEYKDDLDSNSSQVESLCKCILHGFLDQVAIRSQRGTSHCKLPHNRSGEKDKNSIVDSPLFISAELEERDFKGKTTVYLQNNTAIKDEWLQDAFPQDFKEIETLVLNKKQKKVESLRQTQFRDLVLDSKESEISNRSEASQLLAKGIIEEGWVLKKWNHEVETWIRRCNVLATYSPELELNPISQEDRLLIIEQICEGTTSYKEVKDCEVFPHLKQWIPDSLLPLLDDWVPIRFSLPSGSNPKLRYEANGSVILSAKIQQLYDVSGKSLKICQGKCPLKVEILAPNFRPVQITDDLDAFWINAYPQIKKDLFGRYPKHEWR